ncbi:hypothetical protein [Campylobacter volucris]|uniref:hypothetical protein n=1 Tax=Campylobacter volucris TaxID=1031542 RepID=UPI00105A2E11|nr:hypothetical protein E2O25_01890 [Campylobacter volucris]
MIAYLHIGTEKTGTTTIQTFLSSNRLLLQKYGYIFPKTIGSNGSQWSFTFLCYNYIRNDEYSLSRNIYSISNFIKHKTQIYTKLKNEIKKNNFGNVVISSEHLSSRLQDVKEIKRCRKILHILGFREIKIIVYLREQSNMAPSSYSTKLKAGKNDDLKLPNEFEYLGEYKQMLNKWINVFGKENMIVRLFDTNEFYKGDLLKDFIYNINLKWDDKFIIPSKQNESLDLIGMELLKRINKYLPWQVDNKINSLRGDLTSFVIKHFQSKDLSLKFYPSKKIMQSYIDYFEESNEWVRKEFFPHKERLFPKKDLTNYKENYELKEMKPEYWDKIAKLIIDINVQKNTIENSFAYKLSQALIKANKTWYGGGYIKLLFEIRKLKKEFKKK